MTLELVQKMSAVTILKPGSIGARRTIQQGPESMVHHVEAETADLGMNDGAGRISSCLCTLTCAVYKWVQLHDAILQSYPSGDSTDPAHWD